MEENVIKIEAAIEKVKTVRNWMLALDKKDKRARAMDVLIEIAQDKLKAKQ
ncbi:MAG: hypothetical protein IJD36_00430 [Clostridia bacterium]|nr:hypothetical protein [Clostridia bacterium]